MGADEKTRVSGEVPRGENGSILPTTNPDLEKSQPPKAAIHPALYVIVWISLSSSVILFNKWILDTLNFRYPVILTTYHLTFATIMTQILARWTTVLDGRKSVKMTGRVYMRAIVPIGVFFSLSLICGNLTYLYLSVAFIQMLKATTPVAVLLSGWALGVSQPNLKVFLNVSIIVVGVIIASMGEIKFVWIGVIYQIGGVIFEALRLTMVQRLLSSADFKMDPLVSVYYFAPVCAVMNLAVALVWEIPKVSMEQVYNVGLFTFFLNGLCAFLLNVSVVFLNQQIGKTSSLVLTLCGVLKDVMLVVASMMIWGTQVTGLQFFGYSIALGGMVYYKLGYEQIKGYMGEAGRQWADFGQRKPILRKLSIIVLSAFVLFTLLGGLAPTYAPEYDPHNLINEVNSHFGSSRA
ncbi:putative sugar phosphate/phosphate translocator [Colletotrichum gloeosporioides]|uniref:Putative sugar phosphate/phosphate translocator n=1 Tax=Colletotrichum gloeosporioides TaxID=474922 RepID=A0A8H4FEG4_COLGL|nr:putative sugar phosphate/phosphate translocator [Colletotrichum gloeosporioides]KAF3799397.1 putative sugar phosphate/phosphate translocator [Colletotrichum gloeosporioides]